MKTGEVPNTIKAKMFRKNVMPVDSGFQELLTYGFEDVTDNSTVAYLHWDKLKIPFNISLN